jgi:hypothetical protein
MFALFRWFLSAAKELCPNCCCRAFVKNCWRRTANCQESNSNLRHCCLCSRYRFDSTGPAPRSVSTASSCSCWRRIDSNSSRSCWCRGRIDWMNFRDQTGCWTSANWSWRSSAALKMRMNSTKSRDPIVLDPVVPPAPVLELPEDPPPVPPVVCAFMLAAAATSRAEVNANVFFFIVRFLLLGNVGSPPPANRHLAAPCTGDRETYIRENC